VNFTPADQKKNEILFSPAGMKPNTGNPKKAGDRWRERDGLLFFCGARTHESRVKTYRLQFLSLSFSFTLIFL
jgi:hypothetical protein